MELDWNTFFLEIVNFLVLIWILQRFLYRPVLLAIDRRRSHIEQSLASARRLEEQALALKAENEIRLQQWEQQRQSLEDRLAEEIGAKRDHLLADLAAETEKARQKALAREQWSKQEWIRATERRALAQANRFAAKLLARLASPELEAGLFEIMMADLEKLPREQATQLISAVDHSELRLKIASAFPLDPERGRRLADAIGKLAGRALPAEFVEIPELIAGFRVSIGSWVLQANLRDELVFFGESGMGAD